MPTTAVLVTTYDPGYLAIYEHLVRSAPTGTEVVVLDASPLLATPFDNYHRTVLRAFRLEYPGHDLADRMTALGAQYIPLQQDVGDGEPLEPRLEEALAIGVESALITYFRTDRPDRRRKRIGRVADGLVIEGRAVYRAVSRICDRYKLSVGYLPNGRFPHQKMATLAFHDAGVPTRHIEKGEGPGRAYVQDYAPQDRLRSQGSVDHVLADLAPDQVDAIADNWLSRRAPAADSLNDFSSLWSHSLPRAVADRQARGDKIAGFFTSSQDEFMFLGPEWQLHEWDSQFTAFDLMMTRLEATGYRCYLRVHPNLATKAHDTFRSERDGIRALAARHPDLAVIWHDDPANTYLLLDASDAVVVWDSTVGLEASARGLPVWTAATSRYGLVADIHEVLSEQDLLRDGMVPWQVDSHDAKRFIAYLVTRDEDIIVGAPWTSWGNPAPLGARLASIAVSGGIPGVGAAVLSLVDVYRHRRLRANLRARHR